MSDLSIKIGEGGGRRKERGREKLGMKTEGGVRVSCLTGIWVLGRSTYYILR